jgi:hypothetical protein
MCGTGAMLVSVSDPMLFTSMGEKRVNETAKKTPNNELRVQGYRLQINRAGYSSCFGVHL